MQYEISELNFEFHGSDYLTRRMAGYAPLVRSQSCDFLVNLNYSDEIILPKGETVSEGNRYSVLKKEDGSFALYRRLTGFNALSCLVEFSENSADITLLNLPKLDNNTEQERDFYVLGDVFNHFALKHNKMVLHGSSIIAEGKAIIFSAPSETGKSTHTGLWKKYYPDTILLNDDTPVVGKKDNKFLAWGSPWSGKTEINENKSAPLAAVVFLNRGEKNSIERLSFNEALSYLMGQARKIPVKEDMEKVFSICFALAKGVPVYKLYCNISREAVETVRKELNFYD